MCSFFKCWLEHWFGNFYKKIHVHVGANRPTRARTYSRH